MSDPAAWRTAARAQTAMELRLTARRGENLLALIVIPAVVLLFFSTSSLVAVPGPTAVAFLVPGSLTLAVIAAGLVSLGIATAYERSYGVLKRLGGSPLGRTGLLAAKVGSVAVIVALQTVLLVAVAVVLLGWRPEAGLSPILVIGMLAIGTVTFTALGLFLAGTLRAEGTLALANGLFIAALLLGGVIVPTSHLPSTLAMLADVLPAAALSTGLRVAFGDPGDLLPAVVVLVAWGIGAIALTLRTFRWD